jgi:ABC-type bacteriocin/lantibiotic exporter with double-glycine peptidase domain
MRIPKFPQVKQIFDYDCGAKSLEAAFLYYGLDEDYEKIMRVAGTDENGTTVNGMERALRKFKFDFHSARMTILDLKRYLRKKIPVILLLQAWPDEKIKDWSDVWTEGHYVVAVGANKKKVYFEDPWCEQLTFLTFPELQARWHDSVRGRKYRQHGLAVFGRKDHHPDRAVHMD